MKEELVTLEISKALYIIIDIAIVTVMVFLTRNLDDVTNDIIDRSIVANPVW